jgi:hypothetical protein
MGALTRKNLTELARSVSNASLLEHIRKVAGVKDMGGLDGATGTAAHPTIEQVLAGRLSSESSTIRRRVLTEIGQLGQPKWLPDLRALLERETSQNVRRSAIKALAGIGGDSAATMLEEVWFGEETPRFAKQAAQSALRELGLWRHDLPLFNPRDLNNLFRSFASAITDRDSKRGRTKQELLEEIVGGKRAALLKSEYSQLQVTESRMESEEFRLSWAVTRLQQQVYFRIRYSVDARNLAMAEKLIHWHPVLCEQIVVKTSDALRISVASERAKELGLDVELILDNRIRIAGRHWPVFGPKRSERLWRVDIRTGSPECQIGVECMPYGTCESWTECVRLLVRLSRWLAAE